MLFRSDGCRGYLNKHLSDYVYLEPAELIKHLNSDSEKLKSSQISLYGIDVPDHTTVNIFGTNIGVELSTVVQAVQIVLAPILVIWIGSLYTTRFREVISIAAKPDITQTFPHILNIYSTQTHEVEGKVKFVRYLNSVRKKSYIPLRIALTSLFLCPPIVAYAMGMYYSPLFRSSILSVVTIVAISLFGLGVLYLEAWSGRRLTSFSKSVI